MPNTIQIQEILKGYKVDRDNIQSVGNMTVIPIVTDVEFTNVANVNEITLKSDPSYEKLEFKNSSGQIGIALQGWTIIDKQPAQDRTIPYAHLIKAANAKVIPANCVQHTQCGTFNVAKWDQENFMIMPPSLRGLAIKKNTYTNSELGALWSPLKSWIKGIDCDMAGLQNFYSKFEDRLEQFVAQFEPVEKQVGAIVLINDEVVAIDIMPKYNSWKSTWRAFIRDSYGAEAVRLAENNGVKINGGTIDISKIKNFDDLESCYEQMKNSFYDDLQSKIGQILQLTIGYRQLEAIDELTMVKLEGEKQTVPFVGQGVIHGDQHYVYLSLVSTSMDTKTREKFSSLRRNPYTNNDFSF